MFDDYPLSQIIQPLQDWFLLSQRTLPWRENPTPYRIWISEIMLQQTRVEAVRSYYTRFMEALPTVKDLAECPDDRLMKLWEGLGYYSRARNLKIAANQILSDFSGELPVEYTELLKLKGIGTYTAGAIASIAYNQPVPCVDGNVLRVLARICSDDSDIAKAATKKRLESILLPFMKAETTVVPKIFNQALMELGALICIPNASPKCSECPLCDSCLAHLEEKTELLPIKSKAKARKIEKRSILIIKMGESIFLHKRAEKGLLAGLYEFPNLSEHQKKTDILKLLHGYGYAVKRIERLPNAKHVFTHVEWHMIGFLIHVESLESVRELENNLRNDWISVPLDELDQYAIPSAFSAYMEYI